ncbi:hypothetical protein ACFSOZ_24835 [Mesorhizobium newzealandense]|uniref:Uncharacterized protein n=1 Tax=Mesorhizobium newzealandense TaxID=1300302 RepID=A0ABW4UGM3_9HYPH
MDLDTRNLGALARAYRASVTMPVSKDDGETNRTNLQVGRLVGRYMLSVQLAIVIAELAFSSGRAS